MKLHGPFALSVVNALLATACASTPGARPQDMSAAEHEKAAVSHEAQAAPHTAQYDPAAQATATTCDGKRPCWTSISNPTKEHLADADMHKKMASDHRAAGQALRTAESGACANISDTDRDMSPFDHREDITGVEPAIELSGRGKGVKKTVGAVTTFRAVPGLTTEWLQRLVDCHLARNNALGNDVPEMPYCPLVVKGASAKVTSTGNGFAIRVESQDGDAAKEILRRAQSLGPHASVSGL